MTWPTTEHCLGLKSSFHESLKELSSWSTFIICRFTNESHLEHFGSIEGWFAECPHSILKNRAPADCGLVESLSHLLHVPLSPDVAGECASPLCYLLKMLFGFWNTSKVCGILHASPSKRLSNDKGIS